MLSGRGFIFGTNLVAFFHFFRFSVLTKPTRILAFLPIQEIPSSHHDSRKYQLQRTKIVYTYDTTNEPLLNRVVSTELAI